MGLAKGAVTFRRYFLRGRHPKQLTEGWLEKFANRAFGNGGTATSDGVEVGWIAPTHLFDVDFSSPERIAVNQFVHVAMRVERTLAPPAIVSSYQRMEEEAALKASGRDYLTRNERREAKEAAENRAEKEAKAGAFRRINAYPLLIDLEEGCAYFGNLGATANDKLMDLFVETFDIHLVPATIDETAYRIAERLESTLALDDVAPVHLGQPPSATEGDDEYSGEVDSSFLGREMLTWLWYCCDTQEGLIDLSSGRSVALTILGSLQMSCSRNQMGTDTFKTETPTLMPEPYSALRAGKLPTKMGMLIGYDGDEWSMAIDGPRAQVSRLILPPPEEDVDQSALLEYRFDRIGEASKLIDLLFTEFLRLRLSAQWRTTEAHMRDWANNADSTKKEGIRLATA